MFCFTYDYWEQDYILFSLSFIGCLCSCFVILVSVHLYVFWVYVSKYIYYSLFLCAVLLQNTLLNLRFTTDRALQLRAIILPYVPILSQHKMLINGVFLVYPRWVSSLLLSLDYPSNWLMSTNMLTDPGWFNRLAFEGRCNNRVILKSLRLSMLLLVQSLLVLWWSNQFRFVPRAIDLDDMECIWLFVC